MSRAIIILPEISLIILDKTSLIILDETSLMQALTARKTDYRFGAVSSLVTAENPEFEFFNKLILGCFQQILEKENTKLAK